MKKVITDILTTAILVVFSFVSVAAQTATVNTSVGTPTYSEVTVSGSVTGIVPDATNDLLGFIYSSSQAEVYRATANDLGTATLKDKDATPTTTTWTATISGLEPLTKYYIRAVFGVSDGNGGYVRYNLGGVGEFTTATVSPVVADASPVGCFSATLKATIPSATPVVNSEYYFIYSDQYQVVNGATRTATAGQQVTASVDGQNLSSGIDALMPDKDYYFRPVCGITQTDGSVKYYYGDIKKFHTSALLPQTNDATNVSFFSATIGETAPAIPEAESGYMGFVYSTTSRIPTCDDGSSVITYGSTDVVNGGTFTLDLADLEQNKTYYYRAYEYISVPGVGASHYYGVVKSFTTTSYVVKTTGATTNGYFKATATGTVSDVAALGANVEVGFAYSSTNTNPTENDNVVFASSVATSFSAQLVDLEAGVTCYYRALARSYVGGSYTYYYGDVRSFATAPIVVKTGSADEIGYYKATLNGRVSGDRADYSYGVIYSVTAGVNSDNGKVVECDNADANGEYSKDITKLNWGTKYFYVAYARQTLSNGQSRYYYGDEMVFSTMGSNPNPQTEAATLVLTDGATLNGRISTESIDLGTTSLGFVYSTSNSVPEIGDPTTSNAVYSVVNGFDGSFSVAVSGLESSAKYYYRAYAQVTIDEVTNTYYGDVLYVVTGNASMVDLGLSVRWANANIGANSPEEYGAYFAWGETTSKVSFTWANYSLCSGSDTTINKYCTDKYYGNGFTDGQTSLLSVNDVATVLKGSMWRMPTVDEINELINQCTWTWTQHNDVYGYEVKGPNGNSIFLPASGFMTDENVRYQGSYGHYWTGSLGQVSSSSACALFFSASQRNATTDNNNSYLRYQGFSVRAVAP